MGDLKVLIDEQTLQNRIREIAKQIEAEYKGKTITIICILKGSVFFTVDLAKAIDGDVRVEFIRVSSYGGDTVSSGEIKMKLDLKDSINGKDVIVVEDIVDTGRTLSYLMEYLKLKQPNSLKICTLLDKKERRVCEVEPDFVGFEIPDEFVVGFGLDYDEKYRNLPYIGILSPSVYGGE